MIQFFICSILFFLCSCAVVQNNMDKTKDQLTISDAMAEKIGLHKVDIIQPLTGIMSQQAGYKVTGQGRHYFIHYKPTQPKFQTKFQKNNGMYALFFGKFYGYGPEILAINWVQNLVITCYRWEKNGDEDKTSFLSTMMDKNLKFLGRYMGVNVHRPAHLSDAIAAISTSLEQLDTYEPNRKIVHEIRTILSQIGDGFRYGSFDFMEMDEFFSLSLLSIFNDWSPNAEKTFLILYLGRKPTAAEKGLFFLTKQVGFIFYSTLFLKGLSVQKFDFTGSNALLPLPVFIEKIYHGKINGHHPRQKRALSEMLMKKMLLGVQSPAYTKALFTLSSTTHTLEKRQ